MSLAPLKPVEEELIRRIVLGDQRAFERLFRMYYKRLCHFAFLILRSKELSEEAVSDVFFNVWLKREQLVPERNIRSFLYTSVHNRAINYLQRESHLRSHDDINVYELEMESTDPAPDDAIDRELFRIRLQQAFDQLPERCKMISRMHFNDQLQYKEIAQILRLSHKTVEAQIAIATQKIKEIFEKRHWNS